MKALSDRRLTVLDASKIVSGVNWYMIYNSADAVKVDEKNPFCPVPFANLPSKNASIAIFPGLPEVFGKSCPNVDVRTTVGMTLLVTLKILIAY